MRTRDISWLVGIALFAPVTAAAATPAEPTPKTAAPRATPSRTFTPATAPKWIVAATTPAAAPPSPAPKLPKGWKPQKRWAVSPVLGTDGIGGDLAFLATPSLVFRARGTWLGVGHGETYDGVRYDGRLKFATGGLFLDVHPLPGMAHPLFLSAGVMKGRRKASIIATPKGSITYNGHVYTAAEVGTVRGDIALPDTAPFVGLGWDNTFDTQGPFGFKLMAGVAASRDPKVTLTSTGGLLSMAPMLAADLKAEEAKIRSAADHLRYYPVVSTGLTYKF